jgi:hypothetical protein
MSELSQGYGWWQAADQRWYPPQLHPSYAPAHVTPGPPSGVGGSYPRRDPDGESRPPKSYLGWASATIFLFLPTGIVATVYANRVDGLWLQRRHADARTVTCDDLGAGEQIYIGKDGGVLIQIEGDPPKVVNLNMGALTPYDGVLGLDVDPGNDATSATASKNANSYRFAGTAAGLKEHSTQSVTRTFEIDVTCP